MYHIYICIKYIVYWKKMYDYINYMGKSTDMWVLWQTDDDLTSREWGLTENEHFLKIAIIPLRNLQATKVSQVVSSIPRVSQQ